ncbi:hypothetical protein HS125_04465 [bacterium]|nr:hypothetical protein [bacterium]
MPITIRHEPDYSGSQREAQRASVWSDVSALLSGLSEGIARDKDRKKEMEEKVELENQLADVRLERQKKLETARTDERLREEAELQQRKDDRFYIDLFREEDLAEARERGRQKQLAEAERVRADKLARQVSEGRAYVDDQLRQGWITPEVARRAHQELDLLERQLPPEFLQQRPTASEAWNQSSVKIPGGYAVLDERGWKFFKGQDGGDGEGGAAISFDKFVPMFLKMWESATTKDLVGETVTPPKPGDLAKMLAAAIQAFRALNQFLAPSPPGAGGQVQRDGDEDVIVITTAEGDRRIPRSRAQGFLKWVVRTYGP